MLFRSDTVTLREYLENVSLVSAIDDLSEDDDYIKVMTIHNSKGLEFPVVFITGAEDEVFPGKNADFDKNALEEERRLMYVAITRAEEKLYILHADSRFMYGEMSFRTKSRFIEEIPHESLEIPEKREFIPVPRKEYPQKAKLDNLNITSTRLSSKVFVYKAGEKVMHPKFGLGVVRDMDEKRVLVEFVDGKKEIASVVAEKFLKKQ